ncbi:MAG: putative sugar nucleotidyl transferase [Bacteroidetes bacterium]|nr:putative sugar nucleotidyl transferase [Bacteroidota bacterium]MDA0888218.1 putative sugar nucleotidyl transferase [Bacteroidota bacterium]MDA1084340.1 putative sugar nucleotidyl transferase [Bacteroidota bacterium]
MRICLFDGPNRTDLLPLVYTRPVAQLLIGGMTLATRWEQLLDVSVVCETETYLQPKTPSFDVAVLAGCLPSPALIDAVQQLKDGQKLLYNDSLIAFKGATSSTADVLDSFEEIMFFESLTIIRYPWDLFSNNAQVICEDAPYFNDSHTNSLHVSNQQFGQHSVLVGANVTAYAAVINTADGPIIIDNDATIMEGALLRGPLYVGKNAVIKMGAKVYGGTSLGEHVKVGGEINNVVFFGNSNKGHDGFLGNAVVGEWCNLGAATDASNLKNDYSEVRAWNYTQQKFIQTGLQFCGPIIGDHSKTAIHTALNTATVIGVGCNIFSSGFPRTFIPSFSRGGAQGISENRLAKVLETARIVMARREKELSPSAAQVLKHVFESTSNFR